MGRPWLRRPLHLHDHRSTEHRRLRRRLLHLPPLHPTVCHGPHRPDQAGQEQAPLALVLVRHHRVHGALCRCPQQAALLVRHLSLEPERRVIRIRLTTNTAHLYTSSRTTRVLVISFAPSSIEINIAVNEFSTSKK